MLVIEDMSLDCRFISNLRLPIALIGMGITGRSVLELLLAAQIPRNQILTFDAKDLTADFQSTEALLGCQPKTLVVSPGVPLASKWIREYLARGDVFLTSELEIATSLLTTEKTIAVTGSIGKSTCTALLGAGLARFSPAAFIGGNLGTPLAAYALEILRGRPRADWIALELSSYQLENFKNLRADGSILTYLTPNHMERYPNLLSYYDTKWGLYLKTVGPFVCNHSGGDLYEYVTSKRSISVLWTDHKSWLEKGFDFSKSKMVGTHNYDNLSLVMKLAKHLEWPPEAEQGFLDFAGLAHRLENLGQIDGTRWINDSKSTTVESALQAIQSTADLGQNHTFILIGGRDKNLPWKELSEAHDPSRTFVFFGECGALAKETSTLSGSVFSTLSKALDHIWSQNRKDALVLLSPGGTSLDEFKSFEDRGHFFKKKIAELASSSNPPE